MNDYTKLIEALKCCSGNSGVPCLDCVRDKERAKMGHSRCERLLMDDAARAIKELSAKNIPEKPIHHKEAYSKHEWKKDEYGKVDNFAFENGFHNGPVCIRCGFSFCEHCNPDGYDDTKCINEWYECPTCHALVGYKNTYCSCGQRLDWEAT